MPLSATQRQWFERARSAVSDTALTGTLREMVDVASPTGEEAPLACAISRRLHAYGIECEEQAIDARQSNAIGVLPGSGSGPSLLLYSPIDTVTTGDPAEDLPWAGTTLTPHMLPQSSLIDDHVVGLGAQNPKGHAACIVVAAATLKSIGAPLRGDLRLGFGAGGMPTNARARMREDSGHGAGCAYMLEHTAKTDYAVIAKSGWSVSWEEVGVAWYDIWVRGTHTYVGSRHLLPYTNPILQAARLIEGLESWFPVWAERHRSGLVAPQGVVAYIQGGWERMAAFVPALCQLRLDLRLSPRTSAEQADAELGAEVERLSKLHGIEYEMRRTTTIPGTTTTPGNFIIETAIEAWEEIEHRGHQPVAGLSGATDANILRGFGIPTARVGLPKANIRGIDFQQGMNTVAVAAMRKLTHLLLYVAIATCG
jgi:acetylornithine deacetylase/succinyl-diaminopimelate desuccinylase-like protein